MFHNIQALRAVAALLVVWAHVRELFPSSPLIELLPNGLGGVDLFFVISGFIMVASTFDRDVSPAEFMIRRLVRVAPLYYVFTAFVFVLSIVLPSILKSSTPDLEQLLFSLTFIPTYKSFERIYPTYLIGWTLNFEMFFYLVFSVGLCMKGMRRYYVPIAVISFLASLSFLHDFSGTSPVLYNFTRPILLDFVMGMLIALALPRLKTLAQRSRESIYLLMAIGIGGFVYGGLLTPELPTFNHVDPRTDTLLVYGVWAAIIVMSSVALEAAGIVVTNRVVLFIGKTSYSLYLSHYFIVSAAILLCNRLNAGLELRIAVALATYIACVVAGGLCYHLLERRLIHMFRSSPRIAIA